MPRQKEYEEERVYLQVRLPYELRQRLEAESNRRLVSKTTLVERALELAITRWEKEKL